MNADQQSSPITLDDLATLNDEIAALVRAGIPLEQGLLDVAGDVPGKLSAVTRQLAERMQQGASLPEALRRCGDHVPPVYAAVIQAGIGAGRLTAALEGLAVLLRRMSQTRRAALAALVYPLMVLLAAYAFLFFWLTRVAQVLPQMFQPHASPPALLHHFQSLGRELESWGWLPPVMVLACWAMWWWATGRGRCLTAASVRRWYFWAPWVPEILRCSQRAAVSECLSRLVEARVPLPQALKWTADTYHGTAEEAELRRAARQVQRGAPLDVRQLQRAGIPPLAALQLAGGGPTDDLVLALRRAAEHQQQSAEHAQRQMQTFLPVLLVGVSGMLIGGLLTAVYFLPFQTLLLYLART